jgi:hypothetical protein
MQAAVINQDVKIQLVTNLAMGKKRRKNGKIL